MRWITLLWLWQSAIKLAVWVVAAMVGLQILAYSVFVIPPYVGDVFVNTSYGFKKTNVGERVFDPSWKEPFDYEVKVYASTRKTLPKYKTQFFENTQLLWHIPPQTLGNRYPTFKHTTALDISRSVIRDKSFKKKVYAHVFIQKSDQFTPHPNTNYRHGVYAVYQLAWWVNPKETREWSGNSTADVPMELMTATSIPWAILLEDYGYTDIMQTPGYLYNHLKKVRTALPGDGTIPPPFQINSYTRNPHDFMPRVLLRSNETDDTSKGMTIDIDMEICGIRRLWVMMKHSLLRYLGNDYGYDHTTLDLPDLVAVNVNENGSKPRRNMATYLPLALVERFGLPSLTIGKLFHFIYLILFPLYAHSIFKIWLSTLQSFTYISFSAILLLSFGHLASSLRLYLTSGALSSFSISDIGGMVAIYTFISDSGSNTDREINETAAEPQTHAAQNSSSYQPRSSSSNSSPYSHDSDVYLLMRKIAVPFLVALAAYTYYQNGGGIFDRKFALRYIISFETTVNIFMWLPQVVLNYKIRFVMPEMARFSAIGLTKYMSSCAIAIFLPGLDRHERFSVSTGVTYICTVLIVLQWCWYRYN